MGKAQEDSIKATHLLTDLEEKVCTEDNKRKVKKGLKIAGVILGIILAVDVISMIIYFLLFGVPK